MDVIGHDDEFVERDIGKMLWNAAPRRICYLASGTEHDPSVDDLTKNACTVLDNHCYIVGSRRGIIVAFQTNRVTLVALWVVGPVIVIIQVYRTPWHDDTML